MPGFGPRVKLKLIPLSHLSFTGPKEPISLALSDSSGSRTNMHQALAVITEDFISRAQWTVEGDADLNRMIAQEATQIRRQVLQGVQGALEDPFSFDEVRSMLDRFKTSSAAARLPRKASKNLLDPVFVRHWALVHATAQPTFWFCEVCPSAPSGSMEAGQFMTLRFFAQSLR